MYTYIKEGNGIRIVFKQEGECFSSISEILKEENVKNLKPRDIVIDGAVLHTERALVELFNIWQDEK